MQCNWMHSKHDASSWVTSLPSILELKQDVSAEETRGRYIIRNPVIHKQSIVYICT